MNVVAVIPARLASKRFPGKVMADVNGKPMLWHVWSRVSSAAGFDRVCVATDSLEIWDAVKSWGGEVLMTSSLCRSGTERIALIRHCLRADWIVNVQADEALIAPAMLEDVIAAIRLGDGDVITPVYRIEDTKTLLDSSIVKVARAGDGRALYFSRHPIPYVRDVPKDRWIERFDFWGHVGVYAYRDDVLVWYPEMHESRLEDAEKLEQLRMLEVGLCIVTIETCYKSVSVDTFGDLQTVRDALSS